MTTASPDTATPADAQPRRFTLLATNPGKRRTALKTVAVSGFATLGILMVLMAVTETFIAPHYVDVEHGVRHLNDWSPGNCLGPMP